MYQSEPRTRPLYIHLQFGPEREAMHALGHTDVGEDRLDNAQSSGIPGTLQPGQAICFPCSVSIFAFIASITFGCCVSTATERYLRA